MSMEEKQNSQTFQDFSSSVVFKPKHLRRNQSEIIKAIVIKKIFL